MTNPLRVAYTKRSADVTGFAPLLPVTLEANAHTVQASGLLDTGAAVNVLPYSVGVSLGFDWANEAAGLPLSGNLSAAATRMVVASATVDRFAPAPLVFTSVQSDALPILFGQVNFIMEFDVCFFRTRLLFEISPKSPP